MQLLALLLLAIAAVAAVPAAMDTLDAAGDTALHWTTVETGGTSGRVGYRKFGLDITEYCDVSEGTPPKARAYWTDTNNSGGRNINFGDSNMFTEINLGYNVALRIGPYDFSTHSVGLHYGGCTWDQDIDGPGDCGLCDSATWSSPTINCATNSAATRTHHIACMVAVAWQDSAPALLDARANSSPSIVDIAQASRTVTLDPLVIVQPTGLYRPVILPFHFRITEYCAHGATLVRGTYSNGLVVDMDLAPGVSVGMDHRISEYPVLHVGPYAYESGRLRFEYASPDRRIECEWFDDETWRRCGECRAAMWSGARLDCGAGAGAGLRTKEMDCSFIMGYGDLGS